MRLSVADADVMSVNPPAALTVPSGLREAGETVAPGFPKAGLSLTLNILNVTAYSPVPAP